MRAYNNYLGGEWVDSVSGQRSKQFNPADAREFVAEYPVSNKEDALQAVAAARSALPAWIGATSVARGRILSKASQLLVGQGRSQTRAVRT